MIAPSFARFVTVGLVNTLVGYAVILLLHYRLGVGPMLANAGGYVLGMLLSYTLNRNFTFASDRPHAVVLPRFGLAAAGCYALNLLVLKLSLSALALPMALAQALSVVAYTVTFYLVSRRLVFRA